MTDAKTMTVAGKNFNLNGLVQSNTLETQLGNIFHVLSMQNREIEGQKTEMDNVKRKLTEIDDLHRKVAALQTQAEQTSTRITQMEAQGEKDRELIMSLQGRIEELEKLSDRVGECEKMCIEQKEITSELKIDFEQLRADARDALTLASTVSFFKTELMELQEDVTKVLHQAPHTERLMHQVQTNLEKSTEQLATVVGKTAIMEGALGKIALTVDEFKVLKADLVGRIHALENPKFDRMGVIEDMTKALDKQVKLMSQNWMSHWGAHEQSMTLLKQDIMLHVEQLRGKCEKMVSAGQVAGIEGGSLTFVRMDEEERSVLQKAIDQHGRDIARIETKKADASLVLGVLAEKADSKALDGKMDKMAFEARVAQLEAHLARMSQGFGIAHAPTSIFSSDSSFAAQLVGELSTLDGQAQAPSRADAGEGYVVHKRPSTAEPYARPGTAPPASFAMIPGASPEPMHFHPGQQQQAWAPSNRHDAALVAFSEESSEQVRMLQQVRQGAVPEHAWKQQKTSSKGNKRPQSTPPVLPGGAVPGAMSQVQPPQQQQHLSSVQPRQASMAPSDVPGGTMMAQKRLIIARKDKTHPSLRLAPALSISPSTNWVPAPGKIRPTTAGNQKASNHAVYKIDSKPGDGSAIGMAPLPTLGDDSDMGLWRSGSNTSQQWPIPGPD